MEHAYFELRHELLILQSIRKAKQEAFDSEEFLNKTFENDNGLCPQMEKAKIFVQNWEQLKETNCGLFFLRRRRHRQKLHGSLHCKRAGRYGHIRAYDKLQIHNVRDLQGEG